jgi:hypothetical protein
MNMKVEDLKGTDLDYWFGRAQGVGERLYMFEAQMYLRFDEAAGLVDPRDTPYSPSTDWTILGPIVSTHDIYLIPTGNSLGSFSHKSDKRMYHAAMRGRRFLGPTAEEAICRAFIFEVFGEEIPSAK